MNKVMLFAWSILMSFHAGFAQGDKLVTYNNLLCDSSFEQSSNFGQFPNSGCYQSAIWGDANAVLDGASTHVRTGGKSLHIYTGSTSVYYISQPSHIPVNITPGMTYKASVYYLFPPETYFNWVDGSQVFTRLVFLTSTGTEISHSDGSAVIKPTSWTKSEVMAVAPMNAVQARVVMRLEKPQIAGITVINVEDLALFATSSPPVLEIKPKKAEFGAYSDTVFISLKNSGGSPLSYSVLTPSVPWLTITPSGGTLGAGSKKFITARINRTLLPQVACNRLFSAIKIVSTAGPDTTRIPVSVGTPCGAVPNSPSVVTVSGKQLIVGKRMPCNTLSPLEPYTIRGFCWSPASVETQNSYSARRQQFTRWAAYDMGLIKGANANTVYTFLDFGLDPLLFHEVLDTLYQNGIMAVVTVDVDGTYDTATLRQVVTAYRNHPAILMWAIGNEWNINLYHGHFTDTLSAALATEAAAQLVKSLDQQHPVASIFGDITVNVLNPSTFTIVNTLCPSVDIWGLNIYRGLNFGNLFDHWATITGKPMFISEFGVDAFHSLYWDPWPPVGSVNEDEQQLWNHSMWQDISGELSAVNPSKQCLGGTYFEWNDEWNKVVPPGSSKYRRVLHSMESFSIP